MLTASDIRGVWLMAPTPCREGAGGWDVEDSVDYDEAARMAAKVIDAGVGGIAACGTTGEGAALLWEEKRNFIATLVETAKGRVPVFAGTTALGTKETIRQMRAVQDVGADGAFVGLPLWQTPTLENSVQFYADLGEAVPDMAIMAYSNPMFFKSSFPTPFWEGIAAKAPTVVTAKVAYDAGQLPADIAVAGHQVAFLPGQRDIFPAYEASRGKIQGAWSTTSAMGPEPVVALLDAIQKDDYERAKAVWADIVSVPSSAVDFKLFPQYNAQVCGWMTDAAGYIRSGPTRAPYRDLPEDWQRQAELHAAAWTAMRQKYLPSNAG